MVNQWRKIGTQYLPFADAATTELPLSRLLRLSLFQVHSGIDALLTPSTEWREYAFRGKPGDIRRRPPQFAPYHLRLDWLMWFAAMSSPMDHEWFVPFVIKLLEADRPTLRLLRVDPFAGEAPRYVRARLYRYHFTARRL